MTVPPEADAAAVEAFLRPSVSLPDAMHAALEAAAPLIAAEAVAADRKRITALLQAIMERCSDAEFEERLAHIRLSRADLLRAQP